MTLHLLRLLSEVPLPSRRDGVRWIVLECDSSDTTGVFLYLHDALDQEPIFDEWYEDVGKAKSSAAELWGIKPTAWTVMPS